jgi:hypothetical protein
MNNNSIIDGFCPNFSVTVRPALLKFFLDCVVDEKRIDFEWLDNFYGGPDNVPSFAYLRFGPYLYNSHISACEQISKPSQVDIDINIDDEDYMSIGDYDDEDDENMDLLDGVSYGDDIDDSGSNWSDTWYDSDLSAQYDDEDVMIEQYDDDDHF